MGHFDYYLLKDVRLELLVRATAYWTSFFPVGLQHSAVGR